MTRNQNHIFAKSSKNPDKVNLLHVFLSIILHQNFLNLHNDYISPTNLAFPQRKVQIVFQNVANLARRRLKEDRGCNLSRNEILGDFSVVEGGGARSSLAPLSVNQAAEIRYIWVTPLFLLLKRMFFGIKLKNGIYFEI